MQKLKTVEIAAPSVRVCIDFPESMFKTMVEDAGYTITDDEAFKKALRTSLFAKQFAAMVEEAWDDHTDSNDVDNEAKCETLFGRKPSFLSKD